MSSSGDEPAESEIFLARYSWVAVRREQIRNNDELVSFMELAYLDRETERFLVGSEAQDSRKRWRDRGLEIEAADPESFQSVQVHLKAFDRLFNIIYIMSKLWDAAESANRRRGRQELI